MSDEQTTPPETAGKKMAPPRWLAVVLMVVALAYGVSPVDLGPEALLGPLGLTDDAAVIAGALWMLYRSFFGSKQA